MNYDNLRAEITRNRMTIEEFGKALDLSRTAIYRRLNGKQDFERTEILKAKRTLSLSNEDLLNIFFDEEVS